MISERDAGDPGVLKQCTIVFDVGKTNAKLTLWNPWPQCWAWRLCGVSDYARAWREHAWRSVA